MLLSVLLSLTSPADSERGPLYMDQAFAAIHAGNPRRVPLTFGVARTAGTVTLFMDVAPPLRPTVEGQVAAAYPASTIRLLPQAALAPPPSWRVWSVQLWLQPGLFPIRRYTQAEDLLNRQMADPLTGVLTTLAGRQDIRPRIQITVRPASAQHRRYARRVLKRLARPFFRSHMGFAHLYAHAAMSQTFVIRRIGWLIGRLARRKEVSHHATELHTTSTRVHDREDDLVAAGDKLGRHQFETWIQLSVAAPVEEKAAAIAKISEMAGAFGQFTTPRLAVFHVGRVTEHAVPPPCSGGGFLLSCEELATLWHPATATVRAESMAVTETKELEPPATLPRSLSERGLAVLGRVQFRRRNDVFGLRHDDRRRHIAVVGKTGMGKSTLLLELLSSDIRAGRGAGLIDPHGDLAEAALAAVPRERTNDVVLFDAGDRAYPLAFNPLSCRTAADRPLIASGVLSAFKKIFGESWGPRLEHIFRNALLAVLEEESPSLLSVQRLLHDDAYRRDLTSRLADPVVRAFWRTEFAGWGDRFRSEALAPLENKLGHFLSHPILRAIVGQAESTLDLRDILDSGRVLIVNLSKGRIGDDASALLGSLLVTSIQLAAMSRADVAEADRRDFYLYVDEFQNFATESFGAILSEARKYRLNLTIANQFLAQIDASTLGAVFGNVGSLLVFETGAQDSEILAEQLGGDVTPQDLMQLPRFAAYARLLIDGVPCRPFSMRTLAPAPRNDTVRTEIVRRTSRQRYNRPARLVSAEIERSFTYA